MTMQPSALALFLFTAALASPADHYAPAPPEWNRAVEPFRVVGNIYYVGVSDVSVYLITTPKGHFLLDAAFRESVPMIEANIAKLGFRVADVKYHITSHGHYDHVGGLADLKAHTRAKLLVNPAEVPLFAEGDKNDFAWGGKYAFQPVKHDGLLRDGEKVELGGVAMTALFTPGHTKGCTTWTTTVKHEGKTLNVVFPCSVSAPGYQLVDNAKYPEILTHFLTSIERLRALPCDVFLPLHSWDFDLEKKMAARGGANPFIDPQAMKRYLDKAETTLRSAADAARKPR